MPKTLKKSTNGKKKTTGTKKKGAAPKKVDILELYREQQAKVKPSLYAPKVDALIEEFQKVVDSKAKNQERPKIKRALVKLREAKNEFDVSETSILTDAKSKRIAKGFAEWVVNNHKSPYLQELGSFVDKVSKAESKKTVTTELTDKDLEKVKAVIDALNDAGKVWSDKGLNKSEILDALGGPSVELPAGKVSTCVAALVKASKSASEEAKKLIKREGTKYFGLAVKKDGKMKVER